MKHQPTQSTNDGEMGLAIVEGNFTIPIEVCVGKYEPSQTLITPGVRTHI